MERAIVLTYSDDVLHDVLLDTPTIIVVRLEVWVGHNEVSHPQNPFVPVVLEFAGCKRSLARYYTRFASCEREANAVCSIP
jgi:hypothetical protein